MDFNQIILLVSILFFGFYILSAAFAKNFWSRIEDLLWANILLVSIFAQQIVGHLQ